MKKIPCVFQRDFIPRAKGRGSDVVLRPDVTEGCERVLAEGVATIKWDGSACSVITYSSLVAPMSWVPLGLRSSSLLYRRYDAKQGKAPPEGAIPCDEPDSVTGHWPHWIPVGEGPEDRWLREAYLRLKEPLSAGTYEFCGPHVQGNPQALEADVFIAHGRHEIPLTPFSTFRTFEGLRECLRTNPIEGIVFWLDGSPRAKIRRKDFGFDWPPKKTP